MKKKSDFSHLQYVQGCMNRCMKRCVKRCMRRCMKSACIFPRCFQVKNTDLNTGQNPCEFMQVFMHEGKTQNARIHTAFHSQFWSKIESQPFKIHTGFTAPINQRKHSVFQDCRDVLKQDRTGKTWIIRGGTWKSGWDRRRSFQQPDRKIQ